MTTETKTINIHFIDLSPVDENNELTRTDNDNHIGVSFKISRKEYETIRTVQKALVSTRKQNDTPFRYLHVCVQWEVLDSPNLVMNGIEFCPSDSELEISAYGVELNMYQYGERSSQVKADITTYLRDLFPEPKQITQWDELASELSEHITKEINVHITGDFVKIYPGLAHPELDEGINLKELHRFRHLSFQFVEAPAGEDAYMYALELLPDYRSSTGELVLRVSEVDEDGHISLTNTIYATEQIEVERSENGNIDIHISTYNSEQKGVENGLGR